MLTGTATAVNPLAGTFLRQIDAVSAPSLLLLASPADNRLHRWHMSIPVAKAMTEQRRRQTLFSFDTLSLCFGMVRLAAKRIQTSLQDVESCKQAGSDYEEALDAAFLDAWSVVDVCHRIRRIIACTPGIKQREPWLQSFLRATEEIEELRNYVQHLDSTIPSISSPWTPVMGTLSWVSSYDDQTCLTTMLGSLENGVTNSSITYDTVNRCFTRKIELSLGTQRVSILDLCDRIACLRKDLKGWAAQQAGWKTISRCTPIFAMTLELGEIVNPNS